MCSHIFPPLSSKTIPVHLPAIWLNSTGVPLAGGHKTSHICLILVLDSPPTVATKIIFPLCEYIAKAVIQLLLWVVFSGSGNRCLLCTAFLNIFCLLPSLGHLGGHLAPRPDPSWAQNPYLFSIHSDSLYSPQAMSWLGRKRGSAMRLRTLCWWGSSWFS